MRIILLGLVSLLVFSCGQSPDNQETNEPPTTKTMTAKDILGNSEYTAISYGGYRKLSRDTQPTREEFKEDMRLLSAMGIKLLRTYNTTKFPHTTNLLAAIHEMKTEDPDFEMYVMLGAWMNCENAFTSDPPNHEGEDVEGNTAEIEQAVKLANQYPDIVKVIAVGNEAMVTWQAAYFVRPRVILKWVNHLQELKATGGLPADLWVTSSDNFASWGGGEKEYQVEDLEKLIRAVDFVSMHTYPMHDTHYNPAFWGNDESEAALSDSAKIDLAMQRSLEYAQMQYESVSKYIDSLGIEVPIHIGETGWADNSNSFYGPTGAKATDEYKSAIYHQKMRDWTDGAGISCFYFEAFNEVWKDAGNPGGSENHFGYFTVDGKAKYVIWDLVDEGVFDGLTRSGNAITKTYDGNKAALMEDVLLPPARNAEAH